MICDILIRDDVIHALEHLGTVMRGVASQAQTNRLPPHGVGNSQACSLRSRKLASRELSEPAVL